ncbi:MAG: hypothetical protein ABSC77_07680 [Terracidiphilus sp.]|jgi:hypothetical protein
MRHAQAIPRHRGPQRQVFVIGVRFCLYAALLLSLVLPMTAQTSTEGAAKMVSLMQANNYNFITTKSPTVWVIHFTGTHLQDIKVVLALDVSNNSMVIFVTVVEKRRMPVTTDFLHLLLKQNHEYDRVKVGLDADDDLSVRIDAPLRIDDAQEFHDIVTQIKNASDEIYGKIEPQLLP